MHPELCPISKQTPQARVDEDGWCSEHGWDCADFENYLEAEEDN